MDYRSGLIWMTIYSVFLTITTLLIIIRERKRRNSWCLLSSQLISLHVQLEDFRPFLERTFKSMPDLYRTPLMILLSDLRKILGETIKYCGGGQGPISRISCTMNRR